MEITFEKDGFIGIFDNVFEDEYIDQLISFFESKDALKLVQNSSVHKIVFYTKCYENARRRPKNETY